MSATKLVRALTRAVVLVTLAGGVLAAPPAQNVNPNPGLVPPDEHLQGMTYGEWQAALSQWIGSVPATGHPILEGNEGNIAAGQPKHVWFLANTAPVVDRHFTIPSGTALYATILSVELDNFVCVDPDTNYSVDELREQAKDIVDTLTDIEVEIDGVPVNDVTAYRSTTPVFFSTLPADNLPTYFGCTDVPAGTYGPMVADGYALLLTPLPVGEHTIHISNFFGAVGGDSDITWRISVVPHSQLK